MYAPTADAFAAQNQATTLAICDPPFAGAANSLRSQLNQPPHLTPDGSDVDRHGVPTPIGAIKPLNFLEFEGSSFDA